MIADKIISIAQSFIGEQEILGNRGFKDPAFQKFMNSTGWYVGASWCAFLGKGIWMKAYEGTIYASHVQKILTGNALDSYHRAEADGIFKVSQQPSAGALIVFKEGIDPLSTKGHMGVVEINADPFGSIEGNTNSGADPSIREGYIVARKTHHLGLPPNPNGLNIHGFIIPTET